MTDSHSVNLNIICKQECLFPQKKSSQVSDDTGHQQNVNFVKKFQLFN